MVNQIRVKGGVLLSALVSGALAAGTLTGTPTANATCASFWGIGNSADCTSNLFGLAIAIGPGAKASAYGAFGAAFSVGTGAAANVSDPFSFAVAAGDSAVAQGGGLFGIAAALGTKTIALTSGSPSLGNLGFNIALNVSPTNQTSQVTAIGVGNLAVNLFNTGGVQVVAEGVANIASNVGGNGNTVVAGGGSTSVLNTAFNLFGSGNIVKAAPGPLAVAGSILQTGATIKKVGPGFNINGIVVGGAAAVRNAKTSAPTATAVRTGKGTASAASSVGGSKRTAAPSAASVGHKK